MVYRFTIISDEVEDFMREIKIDSDATFFELHKTILDSCGYADDQMTSFSICENGWEKVQDVTLEEMDTDSDEDSFVMAETLLSDLLEDEKQHLLYTFDPLTDRCLFMELSEIITGKTIKAAKVSRSMGEAPQQLIDFDEMLAKAPIMTAVDLDDDDDDDLYGSDISDEEINFEGLDISDGEF